MLTPSDFVPINAEPSAFAHFSVTVDGTTFEGCTHSDPSKIIALIVRDIEHRTFLLRICAKTASLKDIESQFTTVIETIRVITALTGITPQMEGQLVYRMRCMAFDARADAKARCSAYRAGRSHRPAR